MALAAHSDLTLLLSGVAPGLSPGGSLRLVCMDATPPPATMSPTGGEWPEGHSGATTRESWVQSPHWSGDFRLFPQEGEMFRRRVGR